MREIAPAIAVLFIFLLVPVALFAQERIKPADAAKYVGKTATVCGLVASAAYAVANLGTPTYLNLDKPYPNQPFTVIIWGDKRNKFSNPQRRLAVGRESA